METVKLFFMMYWQAISLALSFMVFVLAVKHWWDEVRYFFMRMGWSFPLLGRVARSGRATHKLGDDGWYPVETQLCGDFYRRYNSFNQSPDYYEKCEDYLNKSEELGRSEKGLLLWGLIIGLIMLEAVGFAYVLAPFMAKNASSNEQTMLAWFVAFLLSIAAVFLTELTGKEWHKNGLVSKIREWWSNDNPAERRNLQPEKNISIDKTFGDDASPKYIQLLNRVPANATVTTSYKVTIITIAYIISLAIGAYLVRSYTLEADTTESVNQGQIFNAEQGGGSDPFAAMENAGNTALAKAATNKGGDSLELPDEMASVNHKADEKAKDEVTVARTTASKVTFIILSVIYVMIQVVGIYFGYAFSLIGKESKKARHYTKDFNSSSELNDWLKFKRGLIATDAENYLQRLQERLSHRAVTSVEEQNALKSGLVKRTFAAYVARRDSETHKPVSKVSQPVLTTPQADVQAASIPVATVTAPTQTTIVETVSVAQEQPATPAVGTASAPATSQFQLPPELADLDLCKLDDNDLTTLAADFGLDLEALRRSQRLLRLRQKAGVSA